MELNDFKSTVIPFKNIMYRLAKRLMKNAEDAEDIVQEAFLKLWVKRNDLNAGGNLQALSMITVKNLCLDKLKASYRKVLKLDNEDIQHDYSTPHIQLEEKDIKNKINDIIENLPEQQKMIIHLRDIEGMTNEEISNIMQMNIGTVKVSLSRARKKLKDELVKQFNYEHHEY